uniref:Uncharacterized protein n=1 Tax=Eutreptiella gymnastica TaxID=73025 RepID=A0A7S4GJP0_9EUGL
METHQLWPTCRRMDPETPTSLLCIRIWSHPNLCCHFQPALDLLLLLIIALPVERDGIHNACHEYDQQYSLSMIGDARALYAAEVLKCRFKYMNYPTVNCPQGAQTVLIPIPCSVERAVGTGRF